MDTFSHDHLTEVNKPQYANVDVHETQGCKMHDRAWDYTQHFACVCDPQWRGADCSKRECQSTADPLGGDGAAKGRECSGRGICDYDKGLCRCFKGYYGEKCQTMDVLQGTDLAYY